MKQWIERHKRILQKAASALLAFSGWCLLGVYDSSSENLAQRSLVEFVSHAKQTASNLLRLLPKSRL